MPVYDVQCTYTPHSDSYCTACDFSPLVQKQCPRRCYISCDIPGTPLPTAEIVAVLDSQGSRLLFSRGFEEKCFNPIYFTTAVVRYYSCTCGVLISRSHAVTRSSPCTEHTRLNVHIPLHATSACCFCMLFPSVRTTAPKIGDTSSSDIYHSQPQATVTAVAHEELR